MPAGRPDQKTERGKPIDAGPEQPKPRDAAPSPPPKPKPATAPAADMPLAPSVRKIAAETGIDAATVPGSGKDGRVTKGDMLAAIERAVAQPTPVAQPAAAIHARAPSPPDDAAREERVRMTRLRQTIARRLKDAQNTAAMLTTFNEVDMTHVMALRSQYRDLFEKKHGTKLGFMGFFVRACVQALKEIPAVNAEIDGTDIIYKNYYHIGIAVGTERGLVVPVVRDCDQKSIAEIEQAIADFGRRARDGTLKIEELQGGTFSITNGGIYGSLMSTPILNAPQSGILGMHKIQERPVVRRRQDRGAADDVSCGLLRSPHRRRPRGGDIPGAGEGIAGRPGAAGAGLISHDLRPHRHRHRPRRLCLRHSRRAARPEHRRRREARNLRRHLPQHRLHPVESDAACLRALRGEPGTHSRKWGSRSARRASIWPHC